MNSYTNKKVLITGGLGFIGSNLARNLISQGAEVTLIDSLIPEYGGNLFNIKDIQDKVKVNICDVYFFKFFILHTFFFFSLKVNFNSSS